MSPVAGREAAERLSEKTSRSSRVIAGGMAAGMAMLIGMIALMHVRCVRSPSPAEIRLVNLMTGFAMVSALAAIVASEAVWKAQLKRVDAANVDAVVQTAFLVRSALREGAALMGCVVALIAALNGTLRVYPAYWIDLAPAALFFAYLFLHWPSLDNLKAELDAALPR